MKYAYPWDELKPLSCTGRKWNERERGTLDDSLGGFSTTLVDSLDMFALIGDYAGFRKYVRMVINDVHFNRNVNVSVFETNIRVLGGMLSAHMLLVDPIFGPILMETRLSEEERNGEVPPFTYNGELLDMSLDLGNRMLPAFRTKTGLPSHLVNLKYGIPKSNKKAAKETCVAAAGTLLLEFGILSRLSGVSTFESAAKRAVNVIWEKRSSLNLLGITLNIETGSWKQTHSSIGAGVDSFYEYLLKTYILFGDAKYLKMFEKAYEAVNTYILDGINYQEVSMSTGNKYQGIVSSLAAFWPALQVLKGDIDGGKQTFEGFYELWSKYNAIPDLYHLDSSKLLQYGRDWPLRPELVESAYHLYTATRDIKYLKVAQHVIHTLQNTSRVKCGYASIADVRNHRLDDRMDSYFLSETTKYLFLIFHEAYLHPPVSTMEEDKQKDKCASQSNLNNGQDIDVDVEDLSNDISGSPSECIAWRQTGDCDGRGRREPQFDNVDCDVEIDTYKSGYCECAGTNMYNLHDQIQRFNCGHPPFTCAEECKKYFSNYHAGNKVVSQEGANQQRNGNRDNTVFNDQNEPLPIDMNRVVFSTEGHIFLLWSKLRPSRLPKYESRASSSENYKDVTLSNCPSQENIDMDSEEGNTFFSNTITKPVATNLKRDANGNIQKHGKGTSAKGKQLPKAINIQPETGLKYMAYALGQHLASGGSLSLSGENKIKLECDYRGMCTIGNSNEDDNYALGKILLSIQGGENNTRKDLLTLKGSTAQFGVTVNATHVLGEPLIAEPLDSCTPLTGASYHNAIVLVERGDCSFVAKARNVERAGGAAMIVMDKGGTSYVDEHGETVSVESLQENENFQMADDGTGEDITIPSLLISERYGNKLLDALADDLAENDKVEDEDGRFYVIDMWSDDRRLNPGAAANNNDKKTIRTTTPQVFPLSVLLNMGLLPSNLKKTRRNSVKVLESFLQIKASDSKRIQEKSKKYGIEWQSYDSVAKCNRCEKPFTPLRRKHHCRQCGLIYCSTCTSEKIKVEGSNNLKRVCRRCTNNNSSETSTPLKQSNSNKTTQQLIQDANFYYNGKLENDANVTCNFDGILYFGIAKWYRVVEGSSEDNIDPLTTTSANSRPIYEEKIIRAKDTIYKVTREDIGYKLKCIIFQGKSTSLHDANKKITVITDEIVRRAVPSLENASIQIGLRPHKHTLKCDRTTRICTAAGKYREGETLYVEPNIRGLEIGGNVFIVCRFLRCKEKFDNYGNALNGSKKNTQGNGLPHDKVTMASVLYNFKAETDNELSVEEGDILTCVETDTIDDNDEWIFCMSSNGNKFGAVPRSYVKLYSMPVLTTSEIWGDRVPDLYGEDEALCRYWRSMIGNYLKFDTVAETKKRFEYNLGKSDCGKLIVCEIEMFRDNKQGEIEPLGKAVRSMPVGPIEPAPPRVDDLKIVGSLSINSTLKAQYIYYGGMEGASRFVWIRVNKDGSREELVESKTYKVVQADIGCKIRVKITPVRECGMEGKPTASASVKIMENVETVASDSTNDSSSIDNKSTTTSKRINRLKKARASLVAANLASVKYDS
eukprot:g694.t1